MRAGGAVERLVREERGRVLATLIRVTGDIDLAEDAVQDAVVRALERWPREPARSACQRAIGLGLSQPLAERLRRRLARLPETS
jgi:predicted RNA polymerase sigma factor